MMRGNIAIKRKDESVYGNMLRACRIQEAAKTGKSQSLTSSADGITSVIHVMQESDMEYVTDTMWNRQSVINGSKNLDDLILVRWNLKQELSPWNSILLTKREAITHEAQEDPISMYGDDFVQKIQQKLLLAKRHFGQLPWISEYLDSHYQENHLGQLVPKGGVVTAT